MCIDPQRAELIREELGRIMASDLFCRSDRLCRFLRFSVEQALRGESDRVKEYVVAVEAFGPAEQVIRLTGDCPLIDWTVSCPSPGHAVTVSTAKDPLSSVPMTRP